MNVSLVFQYFIVQPLECNVADLMELARPDLEGKKQERHAKNLETAQREVLTCIGVVLHKRLRRVLFRLRESAQGADALRYVALTVLRRSVDEAAVRKVGVEATLERQCEIIAAEDRAKEVRGRDCMIDDRSKASSH